MLWPRKSARAFKRGQALVEITLILPMLLTLTLGAVELSNLIYTYQVMHHLAAQGASMTARLDPPAGVSADDYLREVINGIIGAACPTISQGQPPANCINPNQPKWRVIYTEIGPDSANTPPYGVVNQIVRGAADVDNAKRICANCGLDDFVTKCSPPGCTPPSAVPNMANITAGGQYSFYAVEVFYDYSPITVLGNFIGQTFAGKLYERSIF
jgi:hypothetical protein